MTASVSIDCPYCGTSHSSFDLTVEAISLAAPNQRYALAQCGGCKKQVLLKFQYRSTGYGPELIGTGNGGPITRSFDLRFVSPSKAQPRIPSDIPENVKKPLQEAEQAYAVGLYSAAGSCYRKTVERAVKKIKPDLSGMLNKRIRQLETEGLLPHSMIELLDQVRLFGNTSMHEDDEDPTKEDCSAARDFCDLFLTYAFSLPAKVAAAKSKLENSD
uniref:DUF4145 domain-containing protein n=1 Tax=Roseovarius sp. BRH_c41 TaxID=1629709 RepID=UPI000A6008BE|nr:DUF4145 domain-containing protein [Roseovarius sp. BRH_c41]